MPSVADGWHGAAMVNLIEEPIKLLKWFLLTTIVGSLAIAVMARILDGFWINGPQGVVLAAGSIAIGQAVAWPIVYRFSSWLPAILFPIVIFVGSGLIILAVSAIDKLVGLNSFRVDGLSEAIWISLGITFLVTLLSAIFSLDDSHSYDRMVTQPLRTKYLRDDVPREPGFLFLEIDGLARPVLEKAIQNGYAPTMQRWIDSGSHTLAEWEPDLSSQTSASQAGILLGSNENIPAFRWWDKAEQRMMVSSSMQTARHLEAALASDRGLLAPNGASRFNVFTGGAADAVGTFSRLNSRQGEISYWAYFANPYTLGRMISLFVQEVAREWWEAFRQTRNDVQPRITRRWTYAFVRAGTTAGLLELTRFMCIADIFRGVPSAYYTIFAYDEVAHHTGIDRDYTLRVLRKIDGMFKYLEEVARTANRPMHFVILSDHGQSQGATFKQRYGKTLAHLVKEGLPSDADVTAILESNESLAHFRAVVAENEEEHPRTTRTITRLIENQQRSGLAESGDPATTGVNAEVTVLASGNLGLISFTDWKERMNLDQITGAFPQLIGELSSHPGIGFVMVNDAVEGGIVFGAGGVYFLESDIVEGENPLAGFGERAAQHLRRTNSFPAAPDILVNSTYWVDDDAVAAFEELVGNHGGLGGTQQRPFLLYPSGFSVGDQEIVGAAQVNQVLRGWIRQTQSDRDFAVEPIA